MANEDSHIVVLKTYDVPQLAHLDEAKLADEGIESFIQDENIVALNPLVSNIYGGIKLLVFEQDLPRAADILGLNDYQSLDDAFEENLEPQTSCPQCGSTEIIHWFSVWNRIVYLLLFFAPDAKPRLQYICAKCGKKWTPTES